MERKEIISNEDYNKEKLRDTRENVLQRFHNLKNLNQLNKSNLNLLLDNCNTIEEIIVYYLDYLRDTKDIDYISELKSYYTIISPKECKKHGIIKISEKEKFHQLIYLIINEKEIMKIVEKELSEVSEEIQHLYVEEVKDLDDEEKEKMKKKFNRWDYIYNKSIEFNDIYNEEYFYYKLSNNILRDLNKGQLGIISRREGIKFFYEFFEEMEKDKNKYQKYFNFICLGLLNASIDDNNREYFLDIIGAMMQELEGNNLSLSEITKILDDLKVSYSIKGKQINFKYKNKNFNFNYENYNFDREKFFVLLEINKFSIKKNLDTNRSFSFYSDKKNYFDGLLIDIISKYVKSNFSKTSIENLFRIKKESYKDLFEIVTTDKILDYIVFLPYNNFSDTNRTLKIYSKIVIDPNKNIFNEFFSQKLISVRLKTSLRKFVNIAKRKYLFEHEQQHLVTLLLFYLYINRKRRINYLPREINSSEIKFLTTEEYKKRKNEENVIKEAGYSFELFCYGKKRPILFKLKELLFIANENNDNLDCKQYRIEYNNCFEKKIDELLNSFTDEHILSNLINEIKEGLEEEKKIILEREKIKKTSDEILDCDFISIAEDELPSSINFEIAELDIQEDGYDNHVVDKNSGN